MEPDNRKMRSPLSRQRRAVWDTQRQLRIEQTRPSSAASDNPERSNELATKWRGKDWESNTMLGETQTPKVSVYSAIESIAHEITVGRPVFRRTRREPQGILPQRGLWGRLAWPGIQFSSPDASSVAKRPAAVAQLVRNDTEGTREQRRRRTTALSDEPTVAPCDARLD